MQEAALGSGDQHGVWRLTIGILSTGNFEQDIQRTKGIRGLIKTSASDEGLTSFAQQYSLSK